MAFHCHQPVFNFDWEIERAYRQAYEPLLGTLEGFPGIKASFHFSGNVLEWLEEKHPAYIGRLKAMASSGQIEIIGGAYSDPIMALIPERDRAEQIRMNRVLVERFFGVKPRGAWLAERVWEPGMADTLARAGVDFTILDDHHMLLAGLEKEEIFKPFLTRGEMGAVALFPALGLLRYYIPFRPPAAVLGYLRDTARLQGDKDVCFFFADDGEKFGAWPHTFRWVHQKGWLKEFFSELQRNAGWLETLTYSEVIDTVEPEEVANVPESSYAEMMQWSGGTFKNFLSKYPEADRMHKRMVSVSEQVKSAASEEHPSRERSHIDEARKELFKAQAGCAYWHGTFGGLYLPHLRSGVYSHLIRAQKMIDRTMDGRTEGVRAIERDLETAGSETVIRNPFLDVFVNSSEGGSVSEIDFKPLDVNLVNSMSRVEESYHRKLQRNYAARIKAARKAVRSGEVPDIHDVLGVAERGLKKELFYDDYTRSSFITHIFRHRIPWDHMRVSHVSQKGFLKGWYASRSEAGENSLTQVLSRRDKVYVDDGSPFDLEVVKRITVETGPAVVFEQGVLKHRGGDDTLRYAVEFNFLVCDRAVGSRPRLMRTDALTLTDMYSGISLDMALDAARDVFVYPVYTVNETESGLKKVHQGTSVLIGGEFGQGSLRENITAELAVR